MIVLILTILERLPDRFKYAVKLDADSAPKAYKLARKFLIFLKIVSCLLFLFLVGLMMQVVQRKIKP